jgi:hypothetical protein
MLIPLKKEKLHSEFCFKALLWKKNVVFDFLCLYVKIYLKSKVLIEITNKFSFKKQILGNEERQEVFFTCST